MGSRSGDSYPYLESDAFNERFERHFEALTDRFWKVERLQSYEEPDTEAVRELQAGRWTKARSLIVEQGRKLAASNNAGALATVNFRRLRRVELPMTLYTRLELELYRALVSGGDEVALSIESETEFGFCRDLLIFDDRAVLVHQHVEPGLSVGGWEITNPEAVTVVADRFAAKYAKATPPEAFHAEHVARWTPAW